ncbi:SDR family NAD(P)-dependent oxidoreductase [Lachnospira multipara]|uniref:SDR family NAD(P)-dependent oxidoreductase n=1 Tax=Lachnospira multipara TaxID=28051 RepID=UPI000A4C2F7E|nr:SDR family NAD(P)-dependent oxidoreductase [Lachnospira multipara]
MGIAVITGASSGIGKEMAKILSHKGYSLILVARNKVLLDELSATLPTKTKTLSLDLSKKADIFKLVKYIKKKKIDIFINNAGFGDVGDFDKTSLSKELDMIDVNIKALHILTKAALKIMKRRNYGYILNVASSAGLFYGGPYMATYYASKAYVTSLTTAISSELKASKSNVSISALCPGPVNTNFNNVANVKFDLSGISARECAKVAIDGMFKKKLIIIPTIYMKLAVFGNKFLPRQLSARIVGKQQSKKIYN